MVKLQPAGPAASSRRLEQAARQRRQGIVPARQGGAKAPNQNMGRTLLLLRVHVLRRRPAAPSSCSLL